MKRFRAPTVFAAAKNQTWEGSLNSVSSIPAEEVVPGIGSFVPMGKMGTLGKRTRHEKETLFRPWFFERFPRSWTAGKRGGRCSSHLALAFFDYTHTNILFLFLFFGSTGV
jgi:hypothetical protein